MHETSITFPRSVGATTTIKLDDTHQVQLFLVDSTVPLYNVAFGSLRFFANADQVAAQIAAFHETADATMPIPAWRWTFVTGFEKSLDGHHDKGWRLSL